MGIKNIVFSMLTIMVVVFALFPLYRKREVKTNKLEINYFEALKNKDTNIDAIGLEYYTNLGMDQETAEQSIKNDKAHTGV